MKGMMGCRRFEMGRLRCRPEHSPLPILEKFTKLCIFMHLYARFALIHSFSSCQHSGATKISYCQVCGNVTSDISNGYQASQRTSVLAIKWALSWSYDLTILSSSLFCLSSSKYILQTVISILFLSFSFLLVSDGVSWNTRVWSFSDFHLIWRRALTLVPAYHPSLASLRIVFCFACLLVLSEGLWKSRNSLFVRNIGEFDWASR